MKATSAQYIRFQGKAYRHALMTGSKYSVVSIIRVAYKAFSLEGKKLKYKEERKEFYLSLIEYFNRNI